MKKLQYLLAPSILLAAFVIWTVLVKVVDIHYIGAAGFLGFYSLNTQINDFVQSMNTKPFDLFFSFFFRFSVKLVESASSHQHYYNNKNNAYAKKTANHDIALTD